MLSAIVAPDTALHACHCKVWQVTLVRCVFGMLTAASICRTKSGGGGGGDDEEEEEDE